VAVGALLGSGCQTDREITRPDPKPVTQELLAGALLTGDDVPSPYVVAEGAEPVGTEMVPEHDCDDDELGDLEPQETAAATFTGTDTTLTHTVSYHPGGGGSVVEDYRRLLGDCAQAVVKAANLSFTTRVLDFGVLTDDTLPLVFLLEHDDGTIDERIVIVMRSGDLISTIRLDGERHTPADLEVLDSVVRVALGRLGLLDQDT
jgi:hypothetical protein